MKRLLAHFVSLHLVFEISQSNVRPSLARAYVPNRPVAIGSGLLWILICVHRLNWISMYSWMTPGAPLALTAHRLSIRPEKGLLIPEFSANSNLRHYNPSSALATDPSRAVLLGINAQHVAPIIPHTPLGSANA